MSGGLRSFDPKATYSSAAVQYARASATYWNFSPRTVELLNLKTGDAVLDVGCGHGPGVMVAAEKVGSSGRVVGIDYAEGMLEIARGRIKAAGLDNVELAQGDMLALPYGPEFDAVLCVLTIFFAEDMSEAARRLWSHVKPGGRLAVTTIGPDFLKPMIGRFEKVVHDLRPDIEIIIPWRRMDDPQTVRSVLEAGGVEGLTITSESSDISFSPDVWWNIVMGSGLRSTAVQLGEQANRVRTDNERWAQDNDIRSLKADAHYAVATKPAG